MKKALETVITDGLAVNADRDSLSEQYEGTLVGVETNATLQRIMGAESLLTKMEQVLLSTTTENNPYHEDGEALTEKKLTTLIHIFRTELRKEMTDEEAEAAIILFAKALQRTRIQLRREAFEVITGRQEDEVTDAH